MGLILHLALRLPSAVFALFLLLPITTPLIAQETTRSPGDTPPNENLPARDARQSICLLIESAARANELPVEFFVRLLWRESRFQPDAVGPSTRSGKHALGIAQFMPATAADRDLLDPLNPVEALPKAAEFLKDLRSQFGNFGLAAAAYNAGARRVRAWMSGKASIPLETRSYVLAVTGSSIDDWAAGDPRLEHTGEVSCAAFMEKLKRPPTVFLAALRQHVLAGVLRPWGAILGADRSRQKILDRYALLQRRFADALSGREPIILERGVSALPRYQVRVGADSRALAGDICKKIHLAGGDCVVLRNPIAASGALQTN